MKKYHYETAAGIFVLVGLVCVGYMTVTLGRVKLLGDGSYRLYARFNSVSGLRAGNFSLKWSILGRTLISYRRP